MKSYPVCEQAFQIRERIGRALETAGMCSVGCSVSLMHRGVIAAAALIAVLSLAPAAIAQQSQSPVPTPRPARLPRLGRSSSLRRVRGPGVRYSIKSDMQKPNLC